jgi:Mg2+ and Co2+ transporters
VLKSVREHDGLLYAVHLDKDGKTKDIPWGSTEPLQCQRGEIVWLHMCAINPETATFLKQCTELDQIVVSNLLAEETRPRARVRDDALLAILRAMNLNEGQEPDDMISLRIWMDDRHVITTRLRDARSIEDMQSRIAEKLPPKTIGEFLTCLTDRIYARMEPFIDEQDDAVSMLEEHLARDELDPVNESLSRIRLQNAIYRRYIVPQRQALDAIVVSQLSWLDTDDRNNLAESLDRVTRYVETLNDVRDRLAILNDETARRHDKALNSTTYIFTAAATIFLPLSFLTGLLGVNVGGIPGIDYDFAFTILIAICSVVAAIQVFFFWRKGWF